MSDRKKLMDKLKKFGIKDVPFNAMLPELQDMWKNRKKLKQMQRPGKEAKPLEKKRKSQVLPSWRTVLPGKKRKSRSGNIPKQKLLLILVLSARIVDLPTASTAE